MVVGTAFGNVERTMRFLARITARGAKQASPAEFPHLVASAAAGNCSIYSALSGPVFSVGDLDLSATAAIHSGLELIELGACDHVVTGGAEASDAIVRRVMGPLVQSGAAVERSEGAGDEAESMRGVNEVPS